MAFFNRLKSTIKKTSKKLRSAEKDLSKKIIDKSKLLKIHKKQEQTKFKLFNVKKEQHVLIEEQIKKQRPALKTEPVAKHEAKMLPLKKETPKKIKPKKIKPKKKILKPKKENWVRTGIEGLDKLLMNGVPNGAAIIVAGGPGSGKTVLCLQMAHEFANKGKAVLYVSLEESSDRLYSHMESFGWNSKDLEKKGKLKIFRFEPFAISRNVEASLAKAKGELIMDMKEIGGIIPTNFKPEIIILDSITALESAFRESEESYRIYIEQMFRYFESLGVTSFMISETENIPKKYSKTGVEEFLADGIIVLYNIQRGNVRERAIEVLKMRGSSHKNQIVAMMILDKKGVEIYPEQVIFGEIE